MNLYSKKTKLIATIGPSSEKKEILKKILEEGVTTIRLNFSHGQIEEQTNKINTLREIQKETHVPVSVMLDTKGPEIRTHEFDKNTAIKANDILKIYTQKEIMGNNKEFSVTYQDLANDVEVGHRILLDDGKLTLLVTDVKKDVITVVAQNHHYVKSRRGVNLPDGDLTLTFLSEKDKKDLKFGCEIKVDYVAASFVRNADDVNQIRDFMRSHGHVPLIISKIECKSAIRNIDSIIEASDAIMVARGDLGIEIPFYNVPKNQLYMLKKCNELGKPIIVATQMLESMVQNPLPTRAEVSDVYFACYFNAHSTMLSGESANGEYPLQAVQAMAKICTTAEAELFSDPLKINPTLPANIKNDIQKLLITNPEAIVITEKNLDLVGYLASAHLKAYIFVLTNDLSQDKYGIFFGTRSLVCKSKNVEDIKKAIKDVYKFDFNNILVY